MITEGSPETKKRMTDMIVATMGEIHDIVVKEFQDAGQLSQLAFDPTRHANNVYMVTMNFCGNLLFNTLKVIQELNNAQEKKQNDVS